VDFQVSILPSCLKNLANKTMKNRRVVITGLGIISPAGLDLDTFWQSTLKGENQVGLITKFDTSNFEVKIASEIKEFNIGTYGFPFMLTRQLDDFTHYALAASKCCLEDAGIDLDKVNKNKIGVFIGNCLGGVKMGERELFNLYRDGFEAVSPYQAISWFYAAPQGQISIRYKLKGYSKTFVADRISSDVAIGYAYKSILLGRMEAALVGGAEASISPYGFLGFMKSGVLSKRNKEPKTAYRPYNLDCDGTVLGEGSGMLFIEELDHALARNSKIYGEITGFYTNNDGCHHNYPDDSGGGFQKVISECMKSAGLTPADIDYINLDGIAIREQDIIETNVLKRVFHAHSDRISLSCPKVSFGHTFGAAGAMDLIINCLVLKHNTIPPTINYIHPNDGCNLDYTPNYPKSKRVETAMQISRGRGGLNSAIIIKRYNGR
jgi:3-oxoacyl-[acyl-carrier-protein] synthase II